MNSKYFEKCNVKWTIFHDDDAFVNYPKFEQIIEHDSKAKLTGKTGSDKTESEKSGSDKTGNDKPELNDPSLYCMWNGIKPQIPMRFSKYKGKIVCI